MEVKKKKKKVAVIFGGELGIATKTLVEFFDFEYLQLPKTIENFHNTEEHFPEEWCFDIKLMYSDLVTAINLGADYVIGLSSGLFSFIGPCRLPYVAECQIEKKLRKACKGDFKYITFKFLPQIAFYSLQSCCHQLGIKIYNPLNQKRLHRALKVIKFKLKILKNARNLMRKIRAKEVEKGTAYKIFKNFEIKVSNTNELNELKTIYHNARKSLKKIEQEKKPVLKVGLVGDLYGILWEFPVFDLENYICTYFNVEIVCPYSFYDWYFNKILKKDKKIQKKLSKYLKYWAGGTDLLTLGSYLEILEKEVDGIIQLRTFGCMPEEISSLAIQAVNKDQVKEPNFMILSYDDHSNPEGIKTRLEAFCNTILRQKIKKNEQAK